MKNWKSLFVKSNDSELEANGKASFSFPQVKMPRKLCSPMKHLPQKQWMIPY